MTVPLKRMAASGPLKLQYVFNRSICQIQWIYAQFMAASALLK